MNLTHSCFAKIGHFRNFFVLHHVFNVFALVLAALGLAWGLRVALWTLQMSWFLQASVHWGLLEPWFLRAFRFGTRANPRKNHMSVRLDWSLGLLGPSGRLLAVSWCLLGGPWASWGGFWRSLGPLL